MGEIAACELAGYACQRDNNGLFQNLELMMPQEESSTLSHNFDMHHTRNTYTFPVLSVKN